MRDIQSVTDPNDLAGHELIAIVDLQIESGLVHPNSSSEASLTLALLPDSAQEFGVIELQRISPPS